MENKSPLQWSLESNHDDQLRIIATGIRKQYTIFYCYDNELYFLEVNGRIYNKGREDIHEQLHEADYVEYGING